MFFAKEKKVQSTYKILIADKNPEMVLVLRNAARRRGHEVLEARTFDDALRVVKESSPDLILADIVVKGVVEKKNGATRPVAGACARQIDQSPKSLRRSNGVVKDA